MKTVEEFEGVIGDIEYINTQCKTPIEFIAECEDFYHSQVHKVADDIIAQRGKTMVVLLAGPSSSGKTTTAHKLSEAFAKKGVHAPVISLDDFLLGLDKYPILPDGTVDMESVYTLDLPLIHQTFEDLFENGEVDMPVFDFTTSSRSNKVQNITLGKHGILIVEGIHALNPLMVEGFDDKDLFYRLYVSPETHYFIGQKEILNPRDSRLIRRIVRDHNFRGRSPLETMHLWKDIIAAEDIYIYPYCEDVDGQINSSLSYEGCIFHHYILPVISDLRDDPTFAELAKDIYDILDVFDDMDIDGIPENSLLREFIGE